MTPIIATAAPAIRILQSAGGAACPFGCVYCFARFTQYSPPPTADRSTGQFAIGPRILYPACDTDILADVNLETILRSAGVEGASLSISSKAKVTRRALRVLMSVSDELAHRGTLLKVSVSIATKHSIERIEPRTAPYSARLDNLRLLASHGIAVGVMLKPVLADIPPEEYSEIVHDLKGLVPGIVVGEEYVAFDNANEAASLPKRAVGWLPDAPIWAWRPVPEQLAAISTAASEIRLPVFQSDHAYMVHLLTKAGLC